MELVFLKFSRIDKVIEITTGCVRFRFKDIEIANDETLQLQLDNKGNLQALTKVTDCMIFEGDSFEGMPAKWSTFGIIMNESFELELKRRLRIMHYSDRELFVMENIQEGQGNGLQKAV